MAIATMPHTDVFIICEDVRQEINGLTTLVGVVGDVLTTPILPLVLPKLSLFIRLAGIETGEHSYEVNLIDETQQKVVVSTGEQEYRVAETTTSRLATFVIKFVAVELRSWGKFAMQLSLSGLAPISHFLLLQPPSWELLYVRCKRCGRLFSSGISAGLNSQINIQSCTTVCPSCKAANDLDNKTVVRIHPPSFSLDSCKKNA